MSQLQQTSDSGPPRSLQDNVLKNAPHTAASVLGDKWSHPYSRELVRPRDYSLWPVPSAPHLRQTEIVQ